VKNVKSYLGYVEKLNVGVIALALPFICLGQTTNLSAFFAPLFADKLLMWSGETNGFRTGLKFDIASKKVDIWILSTTDTGLYVVPPNDNVPRMELRDTNNIIISHIDETVKTEFAQRLPRIALRKYAERWFQFHGNGVQYDYFGVAKGEPSILRTLALNDYWKIDKVSDYSLTVYPVLYKFETNWQFADRIDLPGVTTKLHFAPLPN